MDYGDDTARRTVDNILSGKDRLAMGSDVLIPGEGRTEYDKEWGGRDISIRTGGDTLNDWLASSTFLQYEAYRDGFGVGKTNLDGTVITREMNEIEAIHGMYANTEMALRLSNDFGSEFIAGNSLLNTNVYYYTNLGKEAFENYTRTSFDSTDDNLDPKRLRYLQDLYGRREIDPRVIRAEELRERGSSLTVNEIKQFCEGETIRLEYDIARLETSYNGLALQRYELNKKMVPELYAELIRARAAIRKENDVGKIALDASEWAFDGTIVGKVVKILGAEDDEDVWSVVGGHAIGKVLNSVWNGLLGLKDVPLMKFARAAEYVAGKYIDMKSLVDYENELAYEVGAVQGEIDRYSSIEYTAERGRLETLHRMFKEGYVRDWILLAAHNTTFGAGVDKKLSPNSQISTFYTDFWLKNVGDFYDIATNRVNQTKLYGIVSGDGTFRNGEFSPTYGSLNMFKFGRHDWMVAVDRDRAKYGDLWRYFVGR